MAMRDRSVFGFSFMVGSVFSAIALLAGCADLQSALNPGSKTSAPASTTSPPAPTPAAVTPATPAAAPAPAVTPSSPPPPPPPPPPILPYDTAFSNAATALFTAAQKAIPAGARRMLVIDPLIDGASAVQSAATRKMEGALVELIRKQYPLFDVQPFTRATLNQSPVVLVGTFTAINNAGVKEGPLDAYRICLALADLATGKIMAKGAARAQPEGIDTTPLPYFRDAPAWLKEPQIDGYIRTCQGTKVGDPIDAKYLDAMQVAALVASAIESYAQGRYSLSLDDYRSALSLPGGRQLRVLNGIYLNNLRLNRPDSTEQAFGELVDYGLSAKRLSMFFLFRPGSVELTTAGQLNTPYNMWVRQIAQRAAATKACLEIVGHTSKSGPEPLNDRLSLLRAQTIKSRLETLQPQLAKRTIVNGMGSRATIVGTGADNLSDAPDRRVEFLALDC